MLKSFFLRLVVATLALAPLFVYGDDASPAGTAGGWVKYKGNPVIGAENGIMFDIYLLHDQGLYRLHRESDGWFIDGCYDATVR